MIPDDYNSVHIRTDIHVLEIPNMNPEKYKIDSKPLRLQLLTSDGKDMVKTAINSIGIIEKQMALVIIINESSNYRGAK